MMGRYAFILFVTAVTLPNQSGAAELWNCTVATEFPGKIVPTPRPARYTVEIANSEIVLAPLDGDILFTFALQSNTPVEFIGKKQNASSLDKIHLDKVHRILEVVTQRSDGTVGMRQHGSCVTNSGSP